MKKKNTRISRPLSLFAALALLFLTVFASGCAAKNDKEHESETTKRLVGDVVGTPEETDGENLPEGETGNDASKDDLSKSLVIPIAELSEDAKFYEITVDGIYMEIIAFKVGNEFRTAFNTCQVCYGSPRAYYVQQGSELVCMNCGNRFALSNVGIKTNSVTCSPYPILAGDRKNVNDSMIIPYDFLVKAKAMFRTWKVA